jgi:SOS-response transcriptional repressor LexA
MRPTVHSVDGNTATRGYFLGGSRGSDYLGMCSHGAMMHNASAPRKCLLHQNPAYLKVMGGASTRLKSARERAGYQSAKAAAEAMNMPVATYVQHENGARGFPAGRASRYARFFRVTPEWLLYGTKSTAKLAALGPELSVVGEVAAGMFREAWKLPDDEWVAYTGPADVNAPVHKRFGLRVSGDSMNLLYPEGTILDCVEYDHMEPVPDGKKVIVHRIRRDDTVEATVKELMRDKAGVEWLVPRSSNPSHRAIRGDQPDSDDIKQVEIFAIVVASIRYE